MIRAASSGKHTMSDLTLVIGNKNYSSWSMRPWVLMTGFGIPFKERLFKFGSPEWDQNIARYSPSRQVPVLWHGIDGREEAVWDSLAIMETLHELFPDKNVWPRDASARALARSASAEMHSGFRDLRSSMPMNIRASHPDRGMTPEVAANIKRIETLWSECRERYSSGGDFLFGPFSAADAMYAPVVMRFNTYVPPLGAVPRRYCDAVREARGVKGWIEGALKETEFVADDEPYAQTT
jgi:glutathione S-transferase